LPPVAGIRDFLTRRVVDDFDDTSLSGRARSKRWRVFAETFPEIGEMSVLDLGGDARAWRLAPVRPAHVVLLNIFPQEVQEPWMTAVVGDACSPPADISAADLIYSNSVIEHVGGHWRRERFAESVHAADRYWVQTPNRYFPIEPHFMLPWLQHLPHRAQEVVVTKWPLGNYASVIDRSQALRHLLDIELLSETDMRFYFPDAEIFCERLFGLTKSFVAIRR
jgi:hypothetical protein